MNITANLNEASVLQELGTRIGRHRLENGLTQAALATEAGVAKRTIERIEAGHGAELATIIRLLRVLKLTDGLENLVPDQLPSPMSLLKMQGRKRQRVRPSHNSSGHSFSGRSEKRANSASTTAARSSKKNKIWSWNE